MNREKALQCNTVFIPPRDLETTKLLRVHSSCNTFKFKNNMLPTRPYHE